MSKLKIDRVELTAFEIEIKNVEELIVALE